MFKRLDRTQAATHYYWMCNRWLLFRFDSLGAFSVLLATAGALIGGASAGLAGVVIVQAQQYVRGVSSLAILGVVEICTHILLPSCTGVSDTGRNSSSLVSSLANISRTNQDH